MEDALRCIRIVSAGAALMASIVCAAAQDAAQSSPGKPIQLLQIVEKSDKTAKPKSHVKTATKHKAHARRKAAHAKATPTKTQAAVAPAPDSWPPESAPVLLQPDPAVIEVAGQTVAIAAPDEVNEIDLAADTPPVAALTADVAPAPASGAADVAAAPAPPASTPAAPIGNWSWMAEALAALGGAVAAASAAWFLIGSTPERRYG